MIRWIPLAGCCFANKASPPTAVGFGEANASYHEEKASSTRTKAYGRKP